jgi:hypothetical protein
MAGDCITLSGETSSSRQCKNAQVYPPALFIFRSSAISLLELTNRG